MTKEQRYLTVPLSHYSVCCHKKWCQMYIVETTFTQRGDTDDGLQLEITAEANL